MLGSLELSLKEEGKEVKQCTCFWGRIPTAAKGAGGGGVGEESWDESCEPQADLVLLHVSFRAALLEQRSCLVHEAQGQGAGGTTGECSFYSFLFHEKISKASFSSKQNKTTTHLFTDF